MYVSVTDRHLEWEARFLNSNKSSHPIFYRKSTDTKGANAGAAGGSPENTLPIGSSDYLNIGPLYRLNYDV